MNVNILAWWRERKAEQLRREALAGRASSGHLLPGERDSIFRRRRK